MDILQVPPPGISCWPLNEDKLDQFEAGIVGGKGTPYEGGIFHLNIQIPERYPFEPPNVQFITAIYHPNVDTAGRICLDLLKMPPAGSWKPSWNLSTLLTSIQQLMAEPNPNDPLMVDIAREFKHRHTEFTAKAKEWTQKHAIQKKSGCHKPSLAVQTEDSKSDSAMSTSKDVGRNKLSLKSKSSKRTLQEATPNYQSVKKEKL